MNVLAMTALLLAASSGRMETVSLVSVGSRPGVRLGFSDKPGIVAVSRQGDVARIVVNGATLGLGFSGSDQFRWLRESATSPVLPAAASLIEGIQIIRGQGEVSLYLRLPPDVAIETRREARAVTLFLRPQQGSAAASTLASAAIAPAPALPPASARPAPPPSARPTVVTASAAPSPQAKARPAAAAAPVSPAPVSSRPASSATAPAATAHAPTTPAAAPPIETAPSIPPATASGSALASLAPRPEPSRPEAPKTEPARVEPPPRLALEPARREPQPSAATADMARSLFPQQTLPEGPTSSTSPTATTTIAHTPPPTESADVSTLYQQLFPQTQAIVQGPALAPPTETDAVTPIGSGSPDTGLPVGQFRVKPTFSLSYLNENATLQTQQPVHDDFLQFQPGVALERRVGEGLFRGEYQASLRGLATFDEVNSTTHRAGVSLDLPFASGGRLHASDSFASGILETRLVDPGGEYFFDLTRFEQNAGAVKATVSVGPRMSVDFGGGLGRVRFKEPGGFFDYDTRNATTGFGYELTPTLRATASYVYDEVPRPPDRPQAQSRAHSGEVGLTGDILPLLTGNIAVAYRSLSAPNAGLGGNTYHGLTASGNLTRVLGPQSAVSLRISRGTPVSNFENNAFYVTTALDGFVVTPLPYQVSLDAGLGYRWNRYRTDAAGLGFPRADNLLDWFLGLRRPVRSWGQARVGYRRERRRSNIDTFDTTTDAFVLQLDVNLFGSTRR